MYHLVEKHAARFEAQLEQRLVGRFLNPVGRVMDVNFGRRASLVRHLAGHRFEEILDGVHWETLVPVVEVEVGANLQRMPLQVGDLVLHQHVVEFGALVLGQVDEQDFGRLEVLPRGIRVFRVEKDVRKSQLVAAVGLEHEFIFGIVGRRRQVIDMFLETGDERDLRTAVHLVPRRAVVRPVDLP